MKTYNLIFSKQRHYRFRRHLLFAFAWAIYWVITYLIPTQWIPAWDLNGPKPQIEQYGVKVSLLRILMNTFLMTMIYLALTYGIMYLILPRYLSKNKNRIVTTIYFSLFISTIALINYLFFLMVFSISTRLGYFPKMPTMDFIMPVWGRQVLFNYPTVVGFALVIKFLKNWYIKQKEASQVAREKLNAELQLLKEQVHPHFLFNTLNNIYSFIINDSPAATDAIKKLSTLLHYIIYECNEPMVKLDKELKMIRDYIDLEKIRYGESFNMSLQIQGNTFNKRICPLLLIPFLENSFKHGTSQMLSNPWVNLEIIIDDQFLYFNLTNSKPPTICADTIKGGLGLKNVKKRLSILYPANHSLNISDDILSFSVSLKLPIFELYEESEVFMLDKQAYELV